MSESKVWTCKVGETAAPELPKGADFPMRLAVRSAYLELTGREPEFMFSGWGGALTEVERAVVEDREPRYDLTSFAKEEAARELVEAARRLFDRANHFHVGDVWFSGSDENREALEAVEAAIAKAES